MMELTIYRRLFFGADCYKAHIEQDVKGIQVHSTGCHNMWLHRFVAPDDCRIGLNQYNNSHNRDSITTCASAYIGRQSDGTIAVYQALDWGQRCWLSGKDKNGNANKLGYIGFEVLEDDHTDKAYFEQAMLEKAAALTAYLCIRYRLTTDVVKDHRELHNMGIASNHGDIESWSKCFGYDMDDFRDRVNQYIQEGVDVTYIDCDTDTPALFRAQYNTGKYLNIRSQADANGTSIAQIPKGGIVDVLQQTNSTWWIVRYNGISGYAMQKYLTRLDDDTEDNTDDAVSDMVTLSLDKTTAEAIAKALSEALK